MNLLDYYTYLKNLEVAVYQTQIIMFVAKDALEDFPHNLPDPSDVYDAHTKLANSFKLAQEHELNSVVNFNELIGHENPVVMNTLRLALAKMHSSDEGENFTTILFYQGLVMLLAHLDAFMVNSFQTMCIVRPEILRRDKKLSWEDVLLCGDWNSFIEKVTDEYCFEFGLKSIKEKVQYLNSKYGVHIDIPDSVLDNFDIAQEMRHVIVHNGGRVSQKFINKTDATDIELRDQILVNDKLIESIAHDVLYLGSETFIAIARKFFDRNNEQIPGVWRYKDGIARWTALFPRTSPDSEAEKINEGTPE